MSWSNGEGGDIRADLVRAVSLRASRYPSEWSDDDLVSVWGRALAYLKRKLGTVFVDGVVDLWDDAATCPDGVRDLLANLCAGMIQLETANPDTPEHIADRRLRDARSDVKDVAAGDALYDVDGELYERRAPGAVIDDKTRYDESELMDAVDLQDYEEYD